MSPRTLIPTIFRKLIDELLAGARSPEEITGQDGLLHRLTKRRWSGQWMRS